MQVEKRRPPNKKEDFHIRTRHADLGCELYGEWRRILSEETIRGVRMIEEDYNELLILLKRIEGVVDLHTRLLLVIKKELEK